MKFYLQIEYIILYIKIHYFYAKKKRKKELLSIKTDIKTDGRMGTDEPLCTCRKGSSKRQLENAVMP